MAQYDDELDDELEDELDEQHREIHARMNRVDKKFKAFLEDIADDVMEPELLEKIEKKVRKRMNALGVPVTLTTLKAFSDGFEFGMTSTMKLEGNVAQLFIGLKKVVKDREAKKPKVEIDITKSQVLPPEEEKGK